jgi:hypothetical protein
MPDHRSPRHASVVDRIARIAFTFIMMNCSAVVGVVSALLRRKVWR